MPKIAIAAAIFIFTAAPALAYNKATHMISAAVAYHVLRAESPQTLEKTVALLKQHPDIGKFKLDAVAEADRDLLLLMLAARWPDDIRGNRTYDHPAWHYINFPFKPVGQPDVATKPQADDNILKALEQQVAVIRGTGPAADKAVAVCWLLHLIGDLHQPLHVTSLFTSQFPNGDRGGTRFYIRVKATTAPISLHTLWDGMVLGSDRFQTVRNRAIKLRSEFPPDKLPELGVAGFEDWARESLRLAEEVAYLGGNLAGSPAESSAPALPGDYAAGAKKVAERQVVLAGYRMAKVISE